VFRRVVAAQGGDPAVCDHPERVLPQAARRLSLLSPHAGVVAGIEADEIGMAALVLGAGRRTKEDRIDPAVGLMLACAPGDHVAAGQSLAELHTNLPDGDPRLADATARFFAAIHIGDTGPMAHAPRTIEVIR
jgi:thymidine phosphorylase